MDQHSTLPEPTSTATTAETEPEVLAGILSGDAGPEVPTAITSGSGGGLTLGKLALLLVAGVAVGYGASRLWRA
jgi:hypothetical protein